VLFYFCKNWFVVSFFCSFYFSFWSNQMICDLIISIWFSIQVKELMICFSMWRVLQFTTCTYSPIFSILHWTYQFNSRDHDNAISDRLFESYTTPSRKVWQQIPWKKWRSRLFFCCSLQNIINIVKFCIFIHATQNKLILLVL
jgi:hypothetical protein